MRVLAPNGRPPATIHEGHPREWSEARVVAEPEEQPRGVHVVVERAAPRVLSHLGEPIVALPGPPVISLFTGAGGMDLGLEAAGFTTVCQVEFDQACCQTLVANRPRSFRHAALLQADITATPTSEILAAAGLRCGQAEIVAGGPPCQGFSTSNPRARTGAPDARNDLVFTFLRVVDEARPAFFIFENVQGFTNFNGGAYMEAFLEAAYGAYYELVYGLVDAVEHGVPQYRSRFICMGTRRDVAEADGLLASLPEPQSFLPRDLGELVSISGAPLFADVERSIRRAPGIRYFPDRPVLRPPTPVRHNQHGAGRTRRFREFYDRLEREEPDRLVPMPGGEVQR